MSLDEGGRLRTLKMVVRLTSVLRMYLRQTRGRKLSKKVYTYRVRMIRVAISKETGYALLILATLDWLPYYYDSVDRAGWIYGGWSRRFQLALVAMQ